MQQGLYCDALADLDIIKMNSALVAKSCLIIALLILGYQYGLADGIKQAHRNRAKTMLFTQNVQKSIKEYYDEIALISQLRI